ncbi:hypothetical protein [Streptomyces sp. NBC_01304]|uniref:hypothetical protein n=1 Tax=Streptomyces sp. NBC_01304 TaxID=2903818 RepID=UPI002E0D7BDB|nr:hypothetical protein OG430_49350 [Streptomyces sp. NBC_01304]
MSEQQPEPTGEVQVEEAARCAYPECQERPVPKDPNTPGTPPKYCSNPEHNAMSAYRAKRRKPAGPAAAAAVEVDTDRPVTGAAATAVLVRESVLAAVKELGSTLPRYVELMEQVADPDAAEAQVAAAETKAEARIAEAQQELISERGRRDTAEKKVQAAKDEATAAEEAANQAIDELDAARAQFEAETARIRQEAADQVSATQEAAEAEIARVRTEAETQVADAERRAAEQVEAAEEAAGKAQRDALAQVEAMKKTVEEEHAAARTIETESLQLVKAAEAEVIEARGRVEEAQLAARQTAADAATKVEAAQQVAKDRSEEIQRMADAATTQAGRITTLENDMKDLYAQLRTADGKVHSAEQKAGDLKRELEEQIHTLRAELDATKRNGRGEAR